LEKWIGVVTLFPEMFDGIIEFGITSRAIRRAILDLQLFNPRDYTSDRHRTVDDKPYGGGPGMVMKVQPVAAAIDDALRGAAQACPGETAEVVYMTPQGRPLGQPLVEAMVAGGPLVLLAGRYEGIDERLIGGRVTQEVSIGDFVASGGELPAMMLIDALTRWLPGAVGDSESVTQDSFANGLLDFPHYTRPEELNGERVPQVLISGDHERIRRWRRMQSLGRTRDRRPDLLDAATLSDEDRQLLVEYDRQEGGADG
jgi:tRNA (guanine37-N1)-methyltransferase